MGLRDWDEDKRAWLDNKQRQLADDQSNGTSPKRRVALKSTINGAINRCKHDGLLNT